MEKKKLAILVNSLGRGGAEKIVFLLLKQWSDTFDIHLLLFDKQSIEFDIPSNVKIVQIGTHNNPSQLGLFLNIFRHASPIKKYLIAHDIPVLMSFLSRPAFTAGVVKRLGWQGKLVICERTMTSAYYNKRTIAGKVGRFLVKRLYKKADLIIANSQLNNIDLQKTFGLSNPVITIYNPVDLAEIQKAGNSTTAVTKAAGDFVFCNVGRCDYYKNQQLLLHAFAKLNNPSAKLLIIGKGVPQKLTPLRNQLNLQQSVQLVDVQQNVFPYLLSSDAFVLSSIIEGFPNVLLEALACSLPAIATDCFSGPRELLAPGTPYPLVMDTIETAEFGLLTKNNDADMLAAAMQQMMSNKAMAQQYAAKAYARAQHFDIALIEKDFRNAINGLYATGSVAG